MAGDGAGDGHSRTSWADVWGHLDGRQDGTCRGDGLRRRRDRPGGGSFSLCAQLWLWVERHNYAWPSLQSLCPRCARGGLICHEWVIWWWEGGRLVRGWWQFFWWDGGESGDGGCLRGRVDVEDPLLPLDKVPHRFQINFGQRDPGSAQDWVLHQNAVLDPLVRPQDALFDWTAASRFLRRAQPQHFNQSTHQSVILSADVLLCWSVAFGHLHPLDHSSFHEVVAFCTTVQRVAPVGPVQLTELLGPLVVLLHCSPGFQDFVPLLGGKRQLFLRLGDLYQHRAEPFQLLKTRKGPGTTDILLSKQTRKNVDPVLHASFTKNMYSTGWLQAQAALRKEICDLNWICWN